MKFVLSCNISFLWYLFLKKMGHSRPLFIYFVFLIHSWQYIIIQQYNWIRTTDLWYRKQPLYHLSHNHFPILLIPLGWKVFLCNDRSSIEWDRKPLHTWVRGSITVLLICSVTGLEFSSFTASNDNKFTCSVESIWTDDQSFSDKYFPPYSEGSSIPETSGQLL